MAKNLQVNLTFNADTNAAKAQLQQLQQQLSNLSAQPMQSVGMKTMRSQIADATAKVLELKVALKNATNVDTGKLNFSKFSQQLKQNKMTINDYAKSLQALGPQGAQAFQQLTVAIRNSETPIVSLQGKAAALGKTLANTARWMMSSALLQGVTRAFTGTIDYAKELNESLNNIRIVTNKSEESMSKFAKQANEAAKALSTTTTKYTDASLIYYQQGLSDQEVLKRAETTLKLANVVGEEASTVSEWMTAIWNNFDDGTQQLEYYADVLAKLGAATASSADEIAGGLEKFAAVADTVELSYEYAASALATITAETRQSEDVVGTALKTIFARVENLKLGETLEDGTDLGQYSAALEKVGVNIKDGNDQLRAMDDILDDIGAPWGLLNKSEQVALAQSVAGIRQYNQFIALMNNWDVMQHNVELSKEATGELEYQQQIYSQGMEGATARVQANLEEIKNTLLDENDLMPLLNTAEKFLGVIGDLLDAIGGLPGLLSIVASIGLKIWGPQVTAGIQNMVGGISSFFGAVTGQAQAAKAQATLDAQNATKNLWAKSDMGNKEMEVRSQYLEADTAYTERMQKNQEFLNDSYRETIDLLEQAIQKREEEAAIIARTADEANKAGGDARLELEHSGYFEGKDGSAALNALERAGTYKSTVEKIGTTNYTSSSSLDQDVAKADVLFEEYKDQLSPELREKYQSEHSALSAAKIDFDEKDAELTSIQKEKEKEIALGEAADPEKIEALTKAEKEAKKAREDSRKSMVAQAKSFAATAEQVDIATEAVKKHTKHVDKDSDHGKKVIKTAKTLVKSKEDEIKANKDLGKTTKDIEALRKEQDELYKKGLDAGKSFSTGLTTAFQGLSSTVAGVNMLHGAIDSLATSLAEGSFSFSNFLSSLTSIVMGLPMLLSGIGSLTKGFGQMSKAVKAARAASAAMKKTQDAENRSTSIGTALKKVFTKAGREQARQRKKDAKDNIKSNQEENASDSVSIIVKIAKWTAENPILGALVAAAVLAVLAGAVAMSVNSKKTDMSKEQNRATADETLEKTKEEVEKNKEVYDSYNDLLATYKETGEGKEDLAAAALKVAQAYGIEGAAVAALSGNYDTLTDKIRQARAQELQKLANDAKKASDAGQYAFDELMRQDAGRKTSSGGYKVEFNDGGKATSHDSKVLKIANDVISSGDYGDAISIGNSGKGDFQIDLNNRDSETYARAFEAIEAITQEASKQGATTGNSQLYSEMISWLGKSKEEYDKYKEQETTQLKAEAGYDVLTKTSSNGKTIDKIDNLSDYMSYRENVLNGLDEDSDEYKYRLEEMANNADTAEFETISRAIEEQATKSNGGLSKEKLQNAYKNATEAMVRAMASVEVTAGMSEAEFYAEANNNMLKIAKAMKIEIAKANDYTELDANTYTRVLRAYNKELANNAVLLENLSAAGITLNKGMDGVISTWKEHGAALLANEHDTIEYADALGSLSDAFAEMAGVKGVEGADFTDVIHQNHEMVSEIMAGNLEFYDDLQVLMAEEYALQKGYSDTFSLFQNEIKGKDLEMGELLADSSSELVNYLNEMRIAGKITIGEIENYAKIAGYHIETTAEHVITSITRMYDEDLINNSTIKKLKDEAEKRLLKLEDEIDRYHEIKEVMEDTERELDRIADKKERAFGADKIALATAEIEKQNQKIKEQEQYLSDIEEYYYEDRADMEKYGAIFDEMGRITNYDELVTAQVNAVNSLVNSPEAYEAQKEKYEQFKKDLKQYEQTHDLWETEREELRKEIWEKADKELELIEFELEIKVNFEDDKLEYVNFLMSNLEDNAFAAADAIKLIGGQTAITMNKYKATDIAIKDILEDVNNQGFMTDEQANQLRDLRSQIIEYNSELKEQHSTIHEKLTEAYEAYNDELDKNISKIEHITSVMESYKNIVDIVGKDNLGISNDMLRTIGEAEINSANALLKSSKAKKEANEAYLKEVQSAYDETIKNYGEDSDMAKYWKDQVDAATEAAQESTEEFMGNWENALQVAADNFAMSIELVAEEFSEAMGGIYKNLEQLQEAFDKQKEKNDRYLEQYEKTYEINKLNRSIQDSMDKTDNIAAQKELAKLQKELLAMNESGVKMSKYDIEYMQKKYDLLVAEQALKDAQNAKSVVRLKRDSEGNFGYMYTADQNTVDSAQQNYEDKLYAMQKFGDESLLAIQEQILATNAEFKEALTAIAEDGTLSMEEKKIKADEITQFYTEKLGYWTNEGNKFMLHGQEMNSKYNADMADTFNDTLMSQMYPDLTSFEGYYISAQENMTTAGGDFTKAVEDYGGRIETTMENAGSSVETFADDYVNEYLPDAQQDIKDTTAETENLGQTMVDEMGKAIDAVQDFERENAGALLSVRSEIGLTITEINRLLGIYSQMKTAQSDVTNTEDPDLSGGGIVDVETGTGLAANMAKLNSTLKLTAEELESQGYITGTTHLLNGRKILENKGMFYDISGIADKEIASDTEDVYYNTSLMHAKDLKPWELESYLDKFNTPVVAKESVLKVGDTFSTADIKGTIDTYGSRSDRPQDNSAAWSTLTFDPTEGDFQFQIEGFTTRGDWSYVKLKPLNGDAEFYNTNNKFDSSGQDAAGKNINTHFTDRLKKPWVGLGEFLSLLNSSGSKIIYKKPEGYDTGGYTGAWGPEGRVAMLHQKEIVLNAHDTENFLAAIGIVRDISDQIEKNAMIMQYQNQFAAYRGNITSSGDTLQQEVHITAEFPNATNHSEIEEAFRNLTNLASQYANRK